ncbi:MAG TPA: thioredoxin [Verrucomicrobiales bacterium]|nr:thioredoxin [Verrucomicrobiales bacterium]
MKKLTFILAALWGAIPALAADSAALPRFINLGAGKCIPCKQMTPVRQAIQTEYAGQVEVVFIDVWENRGAGKQYGIRLIPTQIITDASGRELYRHEGYWPKEAVVAKMKELGLELKSPAEAAEAKDKA